MIVAREPDPYGELTADNPSIPYSLLILGGVFFLYETLVQPVIDRINRCNERNSLEGKI